eukprot:Ihof_evm5s201 gene=Ihof_evmTU5s201
MPMANASKKCKRCGNMKTGMGYKLIKKLRDNQITFPIAMKLNIGRLSWIPSPLKHVNERTKRLWTQGRDKKYVVYSVRKNANGPDYRCFVELIYYQCELNQLVLVFSHCNNKKCIKEMKEKQFSNFQYQCKHVQYCIANRTTKIITAVPMEVPLPLLLDNFREQYILQLKKYCNICNNLKVPMVQKVSDIGFAMYDSSLEGNGFISIHIKWNSNDTTIQNTIDKSWRACHFTNMVKEVPRPNLCDHHYKLQTALLQGH